MAAGPADNPCDSDDRHARRWAATAMVQNDARQGGRVKLIIDFMQIIDCLQCTSQMVKMSFTTETIYYYFSSQVSVV